MPQGLVDLSNLVLINLVELYPKISSQELSHSLVANAHPLAKILPLPTHIVHQLAHHQVDLIHHLLKQEPCPSSEEAHSRHLVPMENPEPCQLSEEPHSQKEQELVSLQVQEDPHNQDNSHPNKLVNHH